MSTVTRKLKRPKKNDYPTSDGRPLAETDQHRDLMFDLIKSLQVYYASDPMTYVTGNLLLFYVPGDRLRHLSPDVFVVHGVPMRQRPNYLIREEGKGPDLVIELTSSSTKDEDIVDKFWLYQDKLRVPEYFLFDPFDDYLKPPLQGHRLRQEKYVPIKPVKGRLPSKALGLHLERNGSALRLYDPTTGEWLPTPREQVLEAERRQQLVEDENERLRREVEKLRRRLGEQS